MFFLFFLICFVYSTLRATKDTLVVTSAGAEILPFLKVWGILPAAILFTFIFTRLSNRFSREKVFYIIVGSFLGFFLIFPLLLHPNQALLHPHAFADYLEKQLPSGFYGIISLLRYWTFALFYVMSEMWSTMVMTILFWGFANETTSMKDAKRFYSFLGLGANLATVVAGKISYSLSKMPLLPWKFLGETPWEQSLLLLNFMVVCAGTLSIVLFYWLHKHKLGYLQDESEPEKKKIHMSVRETFKYLMQSRYLLFIALLVVTFNISLTLIEVVWKDQVKTLYPAPLDFQGYMGKVMMSIGIVSTIGALFSSYIFSHFSWTFAALIPPVTFLFAGSGFFLFLLLNDFWASSISLLLGATPLTMSVFFGSLQNCLARACKYTLFDSTKEMAFIPLDKESRLKGKAAIDGVGSRLGKSGASLVHQCFILFFGSISASTPLIAMVLLLLILSWILSVQKLGKEFNALAVNPRN